MGYSVIDEIDMSHITDSDFLYNIRRLEENRKYQILIDIILPNVGTFFTLENINQFSKTGIYLSNKLKNVFKGYSILDMKEFNGLEMEEMFRL